MSNLFSEPVFQQLDASGDVRPGSKLEFFISQTTTPNTVYSDPQLTTPLTQPVVADGAGVFPSIFMDGTNHRVVYKDSNDVQLNVFDPIAGTLLSNTPSLFTRIIEKFTATEGQTVIDLANTYNVGQNELQVWVNGVYQDTPTNYSETDSDTITFTSGLRSGDRVIVSNLKNGNFDIQVERQTASAGQTVFNLTTITYAPGTNKLSVFVNGVFQVSIDNYTETDSTTVTFTEGLDINDFVVFSTL